MRHLPRTDYLIDRSSEKPAIVLDHVDPTPAHGMSFTMAMLFWMALAAGTLTKGVPLLFVLIPMLTLSIATRQWRWWRQLRPLIGVPLLLILVGWWVVWAGMATDWKLINDMVGTHFFLRNIGERLGWLGIHFHDATAAAGPGNDSMQSYSKPPGFYLLTVWGTFFPWSLLLIPAAFYTVKRIRGRTAIAIDPRPYQFLVAWIVPMWILLELSRGKLFHYPLPTFIGIAILCADTLVQSWQRLTDVLAAPWFKAMRWGMLGIWVVMGAAMLFLADRYLEREFFLLCGPFGGALIATGVASAMAWESPSWPGVMAFAWGGTLLCASILLLPNLTPIQVSRQVGQRMAEIRKDEPAFQLGAAGYEEPTLVFYAGQNVTMFGGVDALLEKVPFAPERIPGGDGQYILAMDDATLKDLQSRNVVCYPLRNYVGFNPANHKRLSVTIVTNVPPQAETPATTKAMSPATNPETIPAATSATKPTD